MGEGGAEACDLEFSGRAHSNSSSSSSASHTKREVYRVNSSQFLIGPQKPSCEIPDIWAHRLHISKEKRREITDIGIGFDYQLSYKNTVLHKNLDIYNCERLTSIAASKPIST